MRAHRCRASGGGRAFRRALHRVVGLVAASEHRGAVGDGGRGRFGAFRAAPSPRHAHRCHRHAGRGPGGRVSRAKRRERATHRHRQPGFPAQGRPGAPASGPPRRCGRHPQRRRPLRIAFRARGCGSRIGATGARGASRLLLQSMLGAHGHSAGRGTRRRPRRAVAGRYGALRQILDNGALARAIGRRWRQCRQPLPARLLGRRCGRPCSPATPRPSSWIS